MEKGKQECSKLKCILKTPCPGCTVSETANKTWIILKVLLFEHILFSLGERNSAKKVLKSFLQQSDLAELIERFLMHKQRETVLSYSASSFLDPFNAFGFARSIAWMRDMQMMRASMPMFGVESRALAESIAEFAIDPSRKNFLYWQHYFSDRKEYASLDLFTKCAGYLAYGIE